TLFFVSNLIAFWLIGRAGASIGIAFFIWVGIFNLMIVAQFWSFANDVYTPEQGRRLFAIVGFGATLGAILGAAAAKPLVDRLGLYPPMLIAAGLLVVSLVLTVLVNGREHVASVAGERPQQDDAPIAGAGAFRLVFRHRYLLLIALLMLIYNCV